MKKLFLLHFLFISILSFSQTMNEINIVPQPAEIKTKNQIAKFDFPIIIFFDKGADNFFNAKYLQNELGKRNIPNAISLPENNLKWKSKIELILKMKKL